MVDDVDVYIVVLVFLCGFGGVIVCRFGFDYGDMFYVCFFFVFWGLVNVEMDDFVSEKCWVKWCIVVVCGLWVRFDFGDGEGVCLMVF